MTENKLKHLVQFITVLAMILLCGMLIGLTIQFVSLAKLKKENSQLDKTLNYVKECTIDVETQMDYYSNSQALEDMYRSQGFNKPTDVVFK